MGIGHWLKLILMCATLAGVVVIMRRLNQSPGSMNVAARARTAKMIEGVNLCPTRVTRLDAASLSVFEEGLSWFRQSGGTREKLDPVAVEKWFSQNCTLLGQPASSQVAKSVGDTRTALKVFFVSGEPQSLMQTAGGDYGWMGRWFISAQADKAIRALGALPPATSR